MFLPAPYSPYPCSPHWGSAWGRGLRQLWCGALLFPYRTLLLQGALALWETLSILFTDNTGFPGYFLLENPLSLSLKEQAIQILLAGAAVLYALLLGWAVIRIRSFWLTFALTLPWLMPAFLAEIAMDWPRRRRSGNFACPSRLPGGHHLRLSGLSPRRLCPACLGDKRQGRAAGSKLVPLRR